MSNIVVLGFEGQTTAQDMLVNFKRMQEDGLLKLEDVAIATRGVGDDIEVKNLGPTMTGKYAGRGAGVGLLAGFLLGGPIGGAIAGATIGGLTGKMKDVGMDDNFITGISKSLHRESSMIFLQVADADAEKVLEELRPFKATVISSTLTSDQQKRLEKTLEREE